MRRWHSLTVQDATGRNSAGAALPACTSVYGTHSLPLPGSSIRRRSSVTVSSAATRPDSAAAGARAPQGPVALVLYLGRRAWRPRSGVRGELRNRRRPVSCLRMSLAWTQDLHLAGMLQLSVCVTPHSYDKGCVILNSEFHCSPITRICETHCFRHRGYFPAQNRNRESPSLCGGGMHSPSGCQEATGQTRRTRHCQHSPLSTGNIRCRRQALLSVGGRP